MGHIECPILGPIKLHEVRIKGNDTIVSYFMRISQLRDQIQTIDELISNKELLIITLNGLLESWDAFATGKCARKDAPNFD